MLNVIFILMQHLFSGMQHLYEFLGETFCNY